MHRRFALSPSLAGFAVLLSCAGDRVTAPDPAPVSSFLAASTITSSRESLVADGISSATITVALKDSLGNGIGQSAGTIALQTTTGSLSSVIDHHDGTYSATFTAPKVIGVAVIVAALNGQLLLRNGSISLVAGPPDIARSFLQAADSLVVADGLTTTTVIVYARDVNNNPTSNGIGSVTISATTGVVGGVSLGDGQYFATLKSAIKGTATVTAAIDGKPLSSSVKVRFGGNFWVSASPLPDERQVLAVVVDKGLLYAIGGGGWTTTSYSATVEVYDPATKLWTSRAPMPTARGELAAGVVDGIIYVVGGYSSTDLSVVEAYDPSTDTWSTKASLPTAREGLAVGVVNGILYAVGGNRRGKSPLSDAGVAAGSIRAASKPVFNLQSAENVLGTVEAYDPVTNKWETKAPMITPRSMLGVGVVNGTLYAVGGQAASGGSRIVEAYDPATNIWTPKTTMPSVTPSGISYGRPALGVGVLDGQLYAVGGFQVYSETNLVEAYNPSQDRWTAMRSMPTMRQSLGVGVVNGMLYAVGGACYDDTFAIVEAYVPP